MKQIKNKYERKPLKGFDKICANIFLAQKNMQCSKNVAKY